MNSRDNLTRIVQGLTAGQVDLLVEMANHMSRNTQEEFNDESDILTPIFRANFSNRLVIHHATHEETFKKKSFEYAFAAACRTDGRSAQIVADPTNPGADVIVDDLKYSLKTEAAASINASKITISKLMEARWIRDCETTQDFAKNTRLRIMRHLRSYDRILVLRAFKLDAGSIRYELVEIPKLLLLKLKSLKAKDFRERTAGGSSGADVCVRKRKIFGIRLDGSVEKVTISNLLVEHCIWHGSWTIPTLAASK